MGIAQDHVYNTGGHQRDGIEIKQGSWGNWMAENIVHDTNYPCILLYGTDGHPVNVVERNMCWSSNDDVMQVQGEAIVRNNVAINGNLAFGWVSGTTGGGLTDFTDVSWDASSRDVVPFASGALIGAGDPAHAAAEGP